MLVKVHRIKYHDGPFSVSRIHAGGRTDGQGDTNWTIFATLVANGPASDA